MAEVRRELDLAEQKAEPGQPERGVDAVLRKADPPLPLLDRESGVRPVVTIHRVSGQAELLLSVPDIVAFEVRRLERKLAAHGHGFLL
jgi:hypothetical protein